MNKSDDMIVTGNKYKFPASLLLCILSDGMDWSCRSFWGQVNQYKWYWWYVCDDNGEPDTDRINPDLTPTTSLIQIRDDEDGEADAENRAFTDITLDNLAQATEWALTEYGHLFGYHVSNGVVDDIDYDAIGADVIIQKIVLGEVVYG
jgi:hypothetical protein